MKKIILIILIFIILIIPKLLFSYNNIEKFEMSDTEHKEAHKIDILNSRINLMDSQLKTLLSQVSNNTITLKKINKQVNNIESEFSEFEDIDI